MAIERIVNTQSIQEESNDELLEITLRPKTFADYTGQERIKTNLKLAIEAAKKTWRSYGPRAVVWTTRPR